MAVTNNFVASTLDLNGKVAINQPTALVWGADGRLYVTEADGDVRVLTVAFGDKDTTDGDNTPQFYATEAITLSLVKGAVQNHNDTGTVNSGANRQVTGIDVTQQFDAAGNPVMINGKPAVTIYVSSSDSRIGAGGGGGDANLDTNSGVITKMVQTGPNAWDAIDIVRGLPRSEENHATNGMEVIQVLDANGKLLSERMIVASGGNANTGAPSNNFAGQQEQPLSGAILEIDLSMISGMTVQTTAAGRKFVYDIPTLDDPARLGASDSNDPFGGNDGRNSAKLLADGPVSIYSPGYRNAYDVEVSEDGRVWTYDNGANDSWGGRPIGEAGDNGGATDNPQTAGYIATNLNNGEGNSSDDINLVNWNPGNKDNFHEVTRSDDLAGRLLSAGQGGATTFTHEGQTYVYGGHPNPTRAEGSRAGLLFSPAAGTDNAFLLVSNTDSYGNGGGSDYAEVIAWLTTVEANNTAFPTSGIYGAEAGALTKKVLAVTPGLLYDIYSFADGSGAVVVAGASPNLAPPANAIFLGQAGLPSDIAGIVAYKNPVEGDYNEAGKTDGALDSGNGSINGLTEYTSTILDQGNVKMSGAIIAAQLNGGNLIIMGRNADGTMSSTVQGGFAQAADRTTLQTGAAPLGLASIGDDFLARGLNKAFQGSIWVASYSTTQPFIQIFQPQGTDVPLAGVAIINPTDRDNDGLDHVDDPFDLSLTNGYALAPGEQILIDFNPQNTNFPNTISATGLLGAALDGVTPNRDAQTQFEGFAGDQILTGLYDIGGNILPGGNAPILQIKKVIAGTVVGTANSARDALHTGILPSADTDRIVATAELKNWILEKSGIPAAGQLTGMMFSDGTQSNFVRFVFGAVPDGLGGVAPGFEVGYEIADDYTVLARVVVPGLATAGANTVDLRLTLDRLNDFAVAAEYRLEGQTAFTALNLGGFALPAGVLRDVLTGDHTIGAGDTPSGAAIGFLAENAQGQTLDAVDFYSLKIEAFGNEILADTAAEVGGAGSANVDTVIYTGSDTALAPMAANVENFDGAGSAAAYAVTGNALDNTFRVGAGANDITTGAGDDVVRGTLAQLAGDEITDFSTDDKVLVEGALLQNFNVTYAAGSAVLTINGTSTITFSGAEFEDFAAADGPSVFNFTQTQDGVEITTAPALTPVIAINAGGPEVANMIVREQTLTFQSNLAGGQGAGYTSTGNFKAYSNGTSTSFDFPNTTLDPIHAFERSSAQAAKWGYSVDVEDGTYLIDLIYAEIFHGFINGNAVDNARVFDVFLENVLVADNYDIFDDAGGAGVEVIKSYQVQVTDGTLNIEFQNVTDQAKLSGLVVWKVGGAIVPPADTTAPVIASITVENLQGQQDGDRFAVVVLTDNAGFDAADFVGLTGSDLIFSGIVPATVSAPAVVLSNGGTTATLTYTLTAPGNSWANGVGQITIAAGAYGDAAGNGSAAAQAAFILQNNLADLVRGDVVRAINVGTTDATPSMNLGADPLDGNAVDNNRYGGAIAADSLIKDAAGNAIAFEADNNAYYTSPKNTAGLNANVDGQSGSTGSNAGGVDLDGSAYHTYRDSAAASWTATYSGFAPGIYIIELHFAELFHATAGLRQGDFTLNGQVLALNFDPHTAAGGADKQTFLRMPVTVTDGNIVVGISADTGQPGFSAIVVYQAADPNLPPTISVADVQAVEGGNAIVTFSRTGDLDEAVTLTFTLTAGSADASDYAAPVQTTVVIPANQGSASITIPVVDDPKTEGAESFTVSIQSVSNTSANAVIADGSATITIGASDPSVLTPVGVTMFELDFETAGAPLAQGGFDGLLGGPGAADAAGNARIEGGKLKLTTSNGDLSQGGQTDSKNDFVEAADISDPALMQVFLTTAFDNPFTSGQANYVQQGLIIATGDAATQQNAQQFQKLVIGGNGGDVVQIWSQGPAATEAVPTIAAMSAAAVANGGVAFSFDTIERVEMSMRFDKVTDQTGIFVTFFNASGALLGGVRPEATPGFLTVAPVATPPAVVAAINDGTSVVGVTSTDFDTPAPFEATWDFLRLSSPQYIAPAVGTDSVRGTVYGDFSDDRAAPTAIGTLVLGDNVVVARQQGDSEPGGRERDYFTFTVAEGQVLSALVLQGFATAETGLPQAFIGIQAGPVVTTNPTTFADADKLLGGLVYNNGLIGNDILPTLGDGDEQGVTFIGFTAPLPAGTYTVWLNQGGVASTATLNFKVSESVVPSISLSIANAATLAEGGDTGNATLQFGLTASENFNGTVTVTYDADGQTGLTQEVTFENGVGVLSVAVARDDVNDGADAVAVKITGATNGGDTFEIGTATATGTVTDDDVSVVTLPKGAVVFAVNAGGGAVTDTAGVTYEADVAGNWIGAANTYSDPVSEQPANGDYTGDGVGNADDAVYISERWGGATGSAPLTFQRSGLTPGDYVLTLKFANIFNGNATVGPAGNGVGARVFDVTVNGVKVIDDLDLIAKVGVDRGYDIDVPVTVGANGLLTIAAAASVDNAKISALALFAAPDGRIAITNAPDVTEAGDTGSTVLLFPLTITGPDATATVTYTVNGGVPQQAAVSFVNGKATLSAPVANDDLANGRETVTVALTGVSEGFSIGGSASASGAVTDDDVLPGFGPNDDLDGDTTVNSTDTDIDGDGVLNGSETFFFDATNQGQKLVGGQVVQFDFDAVGTPFQNGLTGALLSPNTTAPEFDLANASVSGGTLNIVATSGDHNNATNTQQNALVAGFRAPEGLRVETRFAAPDFNGGAAGQNTPVNFQAAGVVIGFDQNNLVKAVFGRAGPAFQLVQDNAGGGAPSDLAPSVATAITNAGGYAAVAEVLIALEVFIDTTGAAPVPKATATATLFGANGQPLAGLSNFVIGTITLEDVAGTATSNFGTTLATQVLSGAVLGAGVIQTSTGTGATPFSVGYQYLKVTALGVAPTVGADIADQTTAEDAAFSFALPAGVFADEGGAANLTLTAKLANGDPLPAWLSFADGVFSGTPENADVGEISVAVTATDAAGLSASQTFTLEVTNTNDAPTAVTLSNTVTTLPEGTLTVAVKLADIAVTDDGLGANVLSLAGADAALFEIVGSELFLKAGTALDFETNPSLDVTVQVDGVGVGAAVDASADFTLTVSDVDAAPTAVTLTNTVTTLPEGTLTVAVKLADIAVTDDGEGANVLSLAGADAALFEIVGSELFLKAGTALDFETNPSLDVTVQVDGVGVGAAVDASAGFTLTVSDVAENDAPNRISFGQVQLKTGVVPTAAPNALTLADVGDTTLTANRALVALVGDGDAALETAETAFVLAGAGSRSTVPGIGALNGVNDPVTISAHGRISDSAVGNLITETAVSFSATTGFGARNGLETSGVHLANGDSLTWTLNPENGAPQRLKAVQFVVDRGTTTTATEVAIDFDGNVLRTGGYATSQNAANAQTALRLSNVFRETLVAIDFDARTVSVNGTLQTGSAIQTFFNLYDVSAQNVLTIGGITAAGFTVRDLVIERAADGEPVVNETPSVQLTNIIDVVQEATDLSQRFKVADIVVTDDDEGTNVLALSGADAALFEIVFDELFLKAGSILDAQARPQLDVTVTIDDPTIGQTPDGSATLSLDIIQPTGDLISFGQIQLKPGVTPSTAPNELTRADVGGTTGQANRALTAVIGDGDQTLETGERAFVLGGVNEQNSSIPGIGTLNGAGDPVILSAHGRTNSTTLGALSAESAITFSPSKGFGVRNGVETTSTTLSSGDSITWTLAEANGVAQTLTSARFRIDAGAATGNVEVSIDFDGDVVASGPLGGGSVASKADAALLLVAKNNDEVAIDFVARTLSLNGVAQSGAAIMNFFNAFASSSGDTLTIGGIGVTRFTIENVVLGRAAQGPVNQAPTAVTLSNQLFALDEATLEERVKVADVTVADDGLGTNTLILTGADAGLFEVDATGLYLKADAVIDFETNPSLDVTVQVDDASVGATPDASTAISIAVTDLPDAPAPAPQLISFSRVQLKTGVTPVTANAGALDSDDIGATTTADARAAVAILGDGDTALEAGEVAFVLGGSSTSLASIPGLSTLNTASDPVILSAHGRTSTAMLGALSAEAVVRYDTARGFSVKATVDDGLAVSMTGGESLTWTLQAVDGAPQRLSSAVFTVDTGTSTANTVVALDFDGDVVLTGAATAAETASRADTALTLVAKNNDVIAIDFDARSVSLNGVQQSGALINAFFAAYDVSAKNALTIGSVGQVGFSVENLALGRAALAPVSNLAPTAVVLTNVVTGIAEGTSVATKVADIVVTDDGQGVNTLGLTGADAALFEIVGTELRLKAGQTLSAATNATLDVAVTVDDVAVGATPDVSSIALAIPVTAVPTEQIVLRINAFGPQIAATDGGPAWLADNGAGSSYLVTTQNRGDAPAAGYTGTAGAIPAGVPESVLDNARSSDAPFSYNIPVADLGGAGTFRVKLYIAELFAGNQVPGDRIFDISVEGQTTGILNNFDPSAVGPAGDLRVVSYEVAVTDGTLNIGFLQDPAGGGVDNPIVNAIEIVRINAIPTPTDTQAPTVVMTLTNPTSATSPLLVNLALSDASGINAATLGIEDLQLQVSGFPAQAAVTFIGFAAGVATYQIAAPAAGWTNGLPLTVTLPAGQIADLSTAANVNAVVTQSLALAIGGGGTGGGANFAPTGDLDGDGILNNVDPNIDGAGAGDGNQDDPFAYDAGNGVLLAAGATITLDFNTPGTPFEAGFTGLLQGGAAGAALKVFNENSGTATVSSGTLNVTASAGDTGTGNDPQDDFQLGVKNSAFTVEARLLNPFNGPAVNFQQLGVHIGIDSTDFVKFVFGFAAGVIEYSTRNNDVESKVGGGNIALPSVLGGLAGFEAVDITLVVNGASSTAATVQAFATFLNAAGQPIQGATNVAFGTAAITGALAAAIFDESVGVGAGFTQTSIGGGTTFEAKLDSFKVTAGGGTVTPPDAGNADEAFEAQSDLITNATYASGVNGGAILKIMEGSSSVADSNFGANSFEVENIGAKKISAIFIDVTSALYPDSVFDPDGLGGDNAAKPWAVNTAGGTGGYVSGSGYFLPGQAPIPNSGGSGGPSNGGFKGAMVKFNPTVDGGFQFGEVVGFSGDMDPNSIAGISKSGVDTGATQGWDVGGISGHELIGSLFTVLFDDGTTASGQLIGDKSNAGSVAIAQQGLATEAVSLVVNGTAAGGVGAYGLTPPTVIVTGDPGQLVRITMTRGFDPVTNTTNGIDGVVAQRLSRYDFKANNAYDEQSVDVTIGANGAFDASALFKYGSASNTGKGSFAGDNLGQIGFVASAIGTVSGDVVALGPVTAPIYLNNVGGPVVGGGTAPQGFFQMIGTGNTARFKVQAEDPNGGNGGIAPGGNWNYFNAADPIGTQNATTGDQAGFQGTGYYLFGPNQSSSTGITNVSDDNVLEYTINITETGTYTFRVRGSRDGLAPSDQQNDVWLNFRKQGTSQHIEDYLTATGNEPEPVNQNYIKVIAGSNNGTWAFGSAYDGLPGNPTTQLVITEAGLYTVQIAGRSNGFHMDFWELYKGSAPSTTATNSIFVPTGPVAPTAPTVANPITDKQISQGSGFSFTLPAGTFADADGDTLNVAFTTLPVGFTANGTTITAAAGLATGDYTIVATATDDDLNAVSDTFVVKVVNTPVATAFQAKVLSAADDIEVGLSAASNDLETNQIVQMRFTVGAGVAGVTSVTSALLSWQAERTQSGTSTLTFQVEDSLNAQPFGAGKAFIGGSEVAQITATWTDNATITDVVDLADQINALIASKGPLDAGETINVQLTGAGATRFIQQATAVLDITGGGSGGGGSGSTSASILASTSDVEISTLPAGTLATNLTSSNLEFGTDNFGSTDAAEPQKVNVVGMRFTGLDLPDNAEITNAQFIFQAFTTSTAASDFDISIQNSTSAAAFTATPTDFTDRSFVGNVDWIPENWTSGQTYRSADVSALIEQVIGIGGLDPADALVFRVTGTGVREAHSFDSVSGAEPMLLIEYGLL